MKAAARNAIAETAPSHAYDAAKADGARILGDGHEDRLPLGSGIHARRPDGACARRRGGRDTRDRSAAGNPPACRVVDGHQVAAASQAGDSPGKRRSGRVIVEELLGDAGHRRGSGERVIAEVVRVLARGQQPERYGCHAKQDRDERDDDQRDPARHQTSPRRNPRP